MVSLDFAALLPAPDAFLCPITHEIMCDPVAAADGSVYERAAIQAWFLNPRCGQRSPITNQPLPTTRLSDVAPLRRAIEEYLLLRPELLRREVERATLAEVVELLAKDLEEKQAARHSSAELQQEVTAKLAWVLDEVADMQRLVASLAELEEDLKPVLEKDAPSGRLERDPADILLEELLEMDLSGILDVDKGTSLVDMLKALRLFGESGGMPAEWPPRQAQAGARDSASSRKAATPQQGPEEEGGVSGKPSRSSNGPLAGAAKAAPKGGQKTEAEPSSSSSAAPTARASARKPEHSCPYGLDEKLSPEEQQIQVMEKFYRTQMSAHDLVALLTDCAAAPRDSYKYRFFVRCGEKLTQEMKDLNNSDWSRTMRTAELLGRCFNCSLVYEIPSDWLDSYLQVLVVCLMSSELSGGSLLHPSDQCQRLRLFGLVTLDHCLEQLPVFPELCYELARLAELHEEAGMPRGLPCFVSPSYAQYFIALSKVFPRHLQRKLLITREELGFVRRRLPPVPAREPRPELLPGTPDELEQPDEELEQRRLEKEREKRRQRESLKLQEAKEEERKAEEARRVEAEIRAAEGASSRCAFCRKPLPAKPVASVLFRYCSTECLNRASA